MKKVSVLMPIYNVEKYLVESLESIVHQTYDNYEIICIDDGSTDGSIEILDKYKERYDFIRVLHKENTGYGNSMNIASKMAVGDFIAILEPDDYVLSSMLADIMKIFEEFGDLDFVKCNYFNLCGESEKTITTVKISEKKDLYNRVLQGEEIYNLFLTDHVAHWSAIYRKKFLEDNEIYYHETPGASYQDLGMWFLTIACAKKIYLMDEQYYFYRCDNPSSSMNNPAKVDCTRYEYDYIREYIDNCSNKYKIFPYYVHGRLSATIDTYKRIDESFRQMYLSNVHDDFVKLKNEGLLYTDKLKNDEKRILNALLDSPKIIWNKKCKKLKQFHSQILNEEKIYIYGAGNIAKFIMRLLSKDEKRKLIAFVVTFAPNEKFISGIPVIAVSEISDKRSMYVIGVSDKYRKEVTNKLLDIGVTNIFSFEK